MIKRKEKDGCWNCEYKLLKLTESPCSDCRMGGGMDIDTFNHLKIKDVK